MSEFVKVPVCLYDASTKDIRLYCAFIDFKAFNSEGFIRPPFKRKCDRYFYRYWANKLVKKGWALERLDGISLVSYQQVWRELGILPAWQKRLRKFRFKYRRINTMDLPEQRKDYFKILQDKLQVIIAGNLRRRIKWRLASKQKKESETFLSVRSVARLFHLSSPASGYKYRKKLFNVIDEPTERVPTEYGYRYKCKKVAL